MYEEHLTLRGIPSFVTWLLWVVFTIVGDELGITLTVLNSNSNTFLNQIFIWGFLFFPYFFVSLGQWLLIRRFVSSSIWWLLPSTLGFLFVVPYLLFYGFSVEFTNGQSIIFGTPSFWLISLWLLIMSLVFGGIMGFMQGVLVIRRYGTKPWRVQVWTLTTTIAWGVGYPLGEQLVGSLLWRGPSPYSLALSLAIEGTTWAIIGIITATVFVRLGRAEAADATLQ